MARAKRDRRAVRPRAERPDAGSQSNWPVATRRWYRPGSIFAEPFERFLNSRGIVEHGVRKGEEGTGLTARRPVGIEHLVDSLADQVGLRPSRPLREHLELLL